MPSYRARRTLLLALLLAAFAWDSANAQRPGDWYPTEWQLWCIDVDGTNLHPLDTTSQSRCGSPVWSPDGKQIVYDVSSGMGQSCRVAVINADGSDRRLFGFGAIPTWSPDGKLIAFQDKGLHVMNSDGTGIEKLFNSGHGLRWSPDGKFIASQAPNIWLFDLTTGQARTLKNAPPSVCHGYSITKDGQRFAIGTPNNGLWLATLDDARTAFTTRQLVNTGSAYHTSWAPDDKRIVFAWRPDDDSLTQLYTLDVDSNDPPRIVPGLDITHENVNPSWSPDGKSIVFSRPGQTITP